MKHRSRPPRELSPYQKKLLDPRWQKKRLEIFDRDAWACLECGSKEKTLNVHHRIYFSGYDPWDVPDNTVLETLCEDCHAKETHERRDAEQHLIMTLRGFGVPWYALHVFADTIRQSFPPLPRQQALDVIATLKYYLPLIAQAMELVLPEREERSEEDMKINDVLKIRSTDT